MLLFAAIFAAASGPNYACLNTNLRKHKPSLKITSMRGYKFPGSRAQALKWSAFQNDPEWKAKRAETEKDGPIVASVANMILSPTSFSSVK